jgi:Uma2 family endonuclease
MVPGTPPMTAETLLTLPDDGWRYEVVEGRLVRVAGSGDVATAIGALLVSLLLAFVRPRHLGRVSGADGVYKFPGAETGLIPDAGFYAAARRALIADPRKPIPFAPDLAAEVASPEQTDTDMAAKVWRYLRGGTRLVWVLWPETQTVDVWHPDDLTADYRDMRPTTTLRAETGDILDGEDVISGFTHPVADVFDVDL